MVPYSAGSMGQQGFRSQYTGRSFGRYHNNNSQGRGRFQGSNQGSQASIPPDASYFAAETPAEPPVQENPPENQPAEAPSAPSEEQTPASDQYYYEDEGYEDGFMVDPNAYAYGDY